MRVVQLITQPRGGPVDHAVDVAVELARTGHDSHLVVPPGAATAVAAAAGVQVHAVGVRSKGDLRGARAVAGLLAALRPDVVHLQDRRAGLVGRVLARRTGQATVYTLHGVPDPLAPLVPGNTAFAPPSRRAAWDNLVLERQLARTPRSLVVTPCRALTDYARDHVRIPAERVRTVHNGVGPSWTTPVPPPARPAAGPLRAVWLGVLQPVKRVPLLVEALAEVDGVDLTLVGDGLERPRVEASVRATGTQDRVRLAGFLDDPAPELAAADLLVLPSAAEACPMALLQAMALGLPVIASTAGGIPEIVRHEHEGLLVPTTADAGSWAHALRRAAADADLRAELGAAGRRRVAERFTVARCVAGLLEVYAEAVEGRPAPPADADTPARTTQEVRR